MEVNIISKVDIPAKGGWGKWQKLLGELAMEKALVINFPNKSEAEKTRSAILGSFRSPRIKEWQNYIFSTRLKLGINGGYNLYIWKMERK